MPTANVVADLFMKTLQGALYRRLWAIITNLDLVLESQDCAGDDTWVPTESSSGLI